MKVLILAAGFGKQLHPITDTIPKPIVEVNSTPPRIQPTCYLPFANIQVVTYQTASLDCEYKEAA